MFILTFQSEAHARLAAETMKCLDQHFHLQKISMFFIGQGLSALTLICSRNKDVGRNFRRLLNPVAQPCSS
ncbi:hypothetical protein AO260_31535 [Pseudomonas sp. ABAC21]|nr:hypothetical protein AO260_31535 [Pseudomonas sp. ABAC21]